MCFKKKLLSLRHTNKLIIHYHSILLIMKKYKTLNNRLSFLLVRLACQSKWRQLAFALYNYESHFSDDLKGRIWSVLSRCTDDCVMLEIHSSLIDSESSLIQSSLNRYFDCYLQFLNERS